MQTQTTETRTYAVLECRQNELCYLSLVTHDEVLATARYHTLKMSEPVSYDYIVFQIWQNEEVLYFKNYDFLTRKVVTGGYRG